MKIKTDTPFRLFLVALVLIFMTLFVIVYIKAERFEESMQNTHNNQEIAELKEDDIFANYYFSENKPQQTIITTDSVVNHSISIQAEPTPAYTDEELELLAHLINAEASVYLDTDGTWKKCSDEWQCYVACVALNRVESSETCFPDTLEEVIFQKGQYACTQDGNFEKTPTERAYENARRVLEGYRPVPEDVVFQSEYKLGKLWQKIGNTYFCYS